MQTIGNAAKGGAAAPAAAAPGPYDGFEYVCKFCFKTFKSEHALRGHQNLKLAPLKPILVNPIPIRVYANGDGFAFELIRNGNGKAVGSELNLPAETNFIPVVAMSASAERGGQTVSDEGSESDDSGWELDLDIKL